MPAPWNIWKPTWRMPRKLSTASLPPKKDKASVYVEGLLTNGGPSTDVFKKGLGLDKTAVLFRNILFGTGR